MGKKKKKKKTTQTTNRYGEVRTGINTKRKKYYYYNYYLRCAAVCAIGNSALLWPWRDDGVDGFYLALGILILSIYLPTPRFVDERTSVTLRRHSAAATAAAADATNNVLADVLY